MKKIANVCGIILMLLVVCSCNKDKDEYFERPSWLKGNAYEYLKADGNFSIFLSALEKAGFSDALDGRGLYSVFAPDDEAFNRFFQKKGISSIDDLSKEDLTMLVSYHLIEFAYNTEDFLAFSKTATAEDPEPGDGTSYKFETLAQQTIKEMEDPVGGRTVNVYRQKKFLPVISTELLKTQESNNYEGDYKKFYPNIEWQGDSKHLYVANAAVLQSGIPLDNGYLYTLSEVVDPLPTVYEVLDDNNTSSSYDVFKKMYDRFANMQYNADATKNYAALGDSLFMFYHYLMPSSGSDLPDLFGEWSVLETESDIEARMKYTINCFAPNDDVLNAYIQSFWEGNYDWSTIPLLNLYYLLSAHCANRQTILLPSKLEAGMDGYYGEKWVLTNNDIDLYKMCSNGLLYGINKILEPAMFNMVMSPFFKYDRFSTMLNIAHKQGTFATMVDPDREYTIFAVPDNELDTRYGYSVNYSQNPSNPDVIGARVGITKFVSETNHTLTEMGSQEQANMIKYQTVEGYVNEGMGLRGRKFYATSKDFSYIYTDDGRIFDEEGNSLSPSNTWRFDYTNGSGRGVVYEVDNKFVQSKDNVGMLLFKNTAKYQKFYEALLNANLITLLPEGVTNASDVTGAKMDWLKGDRCMVFAPVNSAWDVSQVPTDSLALDKFLKYFFVPITDNKMSAYVLPNLGHPGTFETRHDITPAVSATMGIDFVDDKRLRVSNGGGSSVLTDTDVPLFGTDGVIFGLTDLIKASN